jgi:putative phage-type endonuclease
MVIAPRVVGPRKLPVRQGSPEWIAIRKDFITATDIAPLLGVDPWKCEQDVADEKLNGRTTETNLAMRAGLALEPLLAEAYTEATGRKVRRAHGIWQSRTIPWAAASPDATAAGRLVEFKWTGSRRTFDDGLPDRMACQVQWQMLVAEVAYADVAALVVGDNDLRIFEVAADPDLQAHLVAIAADFRARLAAGGPFSQSIESLKRRYPRDNGAEMLADSELDLMVKNLLALRAQMSDLEGTEKDWEKRIKERMGEIAAVRGHGYSITWRRTKDREEVDFKALAESLLAPMPEPERAALVGSFVTVKEGFRPFRVTPEKERAS